MGRYIVAFKYFLYCCFVFFCCYSVLRGEKKIYEYTFYMPCAHGIEWFWFVKDLVEVYLQTYLLAPFFFLTFCEFCLLKLHIMKLFISHFMEVSVVLLNILKLSLPSKYEALSSKTQYHQKTEFNPEVTLRLKSQGDSTI
jgi:hypothetical protein